MTDSPPTIIFEYLAASDRQDVDAVLNCFTSDATVIDEDKDWQGHARIRSGERRSPMPTNTRLSCEHGRAGRTRRRRTLRRVHAPRRQLPGAPSISQTGSDFATNTSPALRSSRPTTPNREHPERRLRLGRSAPGSIQVRRRHPYQLRHRSRIVGLPDRMARIRRGSIGDLALSSALSTRPARSPSPPPSSTCGRTTRPISPPRTTASPRATATGSCWVSHRPSRIDHDLSPALRNDGRLPRQARRRRRPANRRILAALGPRHCDSPPTGRSARTIPRCSRPHRETASSSAPRSSSHRTQSRPRDGSRDRPRSPPFLADPYLRLQNYTNNLRRYGYTDDDIADAGSDRLIDALVLHGSSDTIATGLRAHLDAAPTMSPSKSSPPPTTTPCPPTSNSRTPCSDRRPTEPSLSRREPRRVQCGELPRSSTRVADDRRDAGGRFARIKRADPARAVDDGYCCTHTTSLLRGAEYTRWAIACSRSSTPRCIAPARAETPIESLAQRNRDAFDHSNPLFPEYEGEHCAPITAAVSRQPSAVSRRTLGTS